MDHTTATVAAATATTTTTTTAVAATTRNPMHAAIEERSMLPVRCFTCGKVLRSHHPEKYSRYCCKKIVKTFVDYYQEISSRYDVLDALRNSTY